MIKLNFINNILLQSKIQRALMLLLLFAISFSCKSHNNNLNIPFYNVTLNSESSKFDLAID